MPNQPKRANKAGQTQTPIKSVYLRASSVGAIPGRPFEDSILENAGALRRDIKRLGIVGWARFGYGAESGILGEYGEAMVDGGCADVCGPDRFG